MQIVKVISLRGGCARSTPLSMPQLLLIPTATTTVESSATITIMPSSTLGFACAVQRLAHHRALVQGEDELGRKCSRERLGVDSPYAYPGNPHSGARAVVMSLTSCHGQVARTRAPEASARVCQLFVAPPVLYLSASRIPTGTYSTVPASCLLNHEMLFMLCPARVC